MIAQNQSMPEKRDLFGVSVSVTHYDQVVDALIGAAKRGESALADFMPVHGLVTAATDATWRKQINDFDIVAPDGQPVRWALNRFHHAGLADRVYGPELTRRICAAAAREDVSIYLYGSTQPVIDKLHVELPRLCPGLVIAGSESPPFRPLTDEEDAAMVQRVNASGAGLLLLGIGCPRQEQFAWAHRDRIKAVQLCVGAAFDFHAGVKPMAPKWMQDRGLEWLFRLASEPRRLAKRYFVTNTLFSLFVLRRMALGY